MSGKLFKRLSITPHWLRQPARRTAAVVASVVLLGILVPLTASAVGDPCSPMVNAVACENSKPGADPESWDVGGAGNASIQGFATDISVNVGQRIDFKVKTNASSYVVDIYRLGYYGGNGARFITQVNPSATLPQAQPNCITDPATEIYDCGNWGVSAFWNVPASVVSGVYIAKLTRPDLDESSHIVFVVRDDSSHSDLIYQTSDTTWQAYNTYGGSDFYSGDANGRAYKVSYNRPFATRASNSGRDYLFSNEYPMIRFLESNGYDVSYTSGLDSDRRGALIKNHRVFVSVGHDEYWSGQQRANVESARDAGVNLAFFSGNEVYWKTRWEPSVDGSNTSNRTLVCYKETWANAKIDPSSEWTGTWRDPRFSPPSNGGRPENALTGTAFLANHDDLAVQVSAAEGKYRLWRGTSLASLTAGSVASLAPHTVGYESDEDLDNGFRPAGLARLSTTTGPTPQLLRDFGNVVSPGTTTHNLTLYRASSGALVFSAGTVQWAWGLDATHDGTQSPADSRMQQAMINLFADMGVQPGTLVSGLVAASPSTDTQAPTVAITSPAAGASVVNGSQVTLQGTAADVGGGRVTAVEVSTDGGTTWHAANGTTAWTYVFYAGGLSTQQILVRAVDDSANHGQTPASLQLTMTGPNSLFGDVTPAVPSASDSSAIELGVRFTTQASGYVTGIRFYKGAGNTGTHTGSLWLENGTRIGTGTFTGETASGWQKLTFTTAVAITANTRYIATYFAPNGQYAADPYKFSYADVVSAPLVALRSTSVSGNGLFRYGGGFPSQSYQDTNHYVDVLFSPNDTTIPSVVSTTPVDAATDVPVNTTATATFTKAMNSATIQFTLTSSGGTVAGTTTYNSTTKTTTFTPSAVLSAATIYQASVQASDTLGNAMTSPATWSFTTELDPSVSKLFATNAIPANVSINDSGAVELGVKFIPAVNGTIIGVRYYQGPGNTGTHYGSLWTIGGTLLARVTFPAGSGSGWQTATFDAPVGVTGGTTYVASYYAPNGHYAANSNFFASTYVNGQLSAPAGNNGVYRYGSTSLFPNSSYQNTNYWVDPLFVAGGTAPLPSSMSLFLAAETPASPNWNEAAALELGVKFSSDVSGTITALRFYKGSLNGGVHTGSVWSSTGQLLATAPYQNETSSGWQTVTLSQPLAITAGTTYVVSYRTTVGYYSVNVNAFQGTGFDRGPLHVPAGGAAYRYGSGFPSNTSNHNFWVDFVFNPS